MFSWLRKKKPLARPAGDTPATGLWDRPAGMSQDTMPPTAGAASVDELPLDIAAIPFPESEPEGALVDSTRLLELPLPAPDPTMGSDHDASAPALEFYAGDATAYPEAQLSAAPVGQLPAHPAAGDLVRTAVEAAGLAGPERAETLSAWSAVLERHAGTAGEGAWHALLLELRRRKLRAAAAVVAEALAAAHKEAAWPLVELGRLHGAGADHAATLAIGQRLCARFPHAPEGAPLVVQGLLGLDRRADAERFYDSLPDTFPDQDWYLTNGLRFARVHGDTDRVLALAARLRAVAPDRPLAYTLPSSLLRQAGQYAQADALAAQAIAACPGSVEAWREAARTAQALGDTALAFQRWAGLRAHHPRSSAGHVGAVHLAERLRQPDTVRGLLADGLATFPDDRDLLMAKARDAAEAGDWEDAATRWSGLISRTPNDPAIRVAAAIALMGPPESRAALLPRLTALLDETGALFPDHVPAGIAHLRLLREAGQLAQASEVGNAWGRRFADNQGLAIARSRIAVLDGQPGVALAILEANRAISPRTGLLEAAYVRALSLAGRVEEADRVCAESLAGLPGDAGLLAEHVRIAMQREDWSQALSRAERATQVRPEDAMLRALLGRVRTQRAPLEDE